MNQCQKKSKVMQNLIAILALRNKTLKHKIGNRLFSVNSKCIVVLIITRQHCSCLLRHNLSVLILTVCMFKTPSQLKMQN